MTTTSTDYDYVQISGSTVVWGEYYSANSEYDLWYSTNGATPIRINSSSTFSDSSPSISGTKIVFKRDDTSGTDTANDGIQLFDITTSTTTALSSASDNDSNPKISGSLIAWERYYSGNSEYDIKYSTGGEVQSVNTFTTLSDYSPAVSGTKIAFYRNDKSGTNVTGDGIYLFDTETTSLTQLISGKEQVYSPQISGSNVTWFSGSEDDVQYSINGGSYRSVSKSSTLSDYSPHISGTKIAFYRNDLGGTNIAGDGIYLFETSTSALVQLSSGNESVGAPLISDSNVFWIDSSSTPKALFYDGTTTADSFGFTVSDGSLTTNGALNITIS